MKNIKTQKPVKLSKQETRVLALLLKENKNSEIAKIMGLDEKTICTYKVRILIKLNVKTIIGMYIYNLEHKLVDLTKDVELKTK